MRNDYGKYFGLCYCGCKHIQLPCNARNVRFIVEREVREIEENQHRFIR